jgi:hypothetical protein
MNKTWIVGASISICCLLSIAVVVALLKTHKQSPSTTGSSSAGGGPLASAFMGKQNTYFKVVLEKPNGIDVRALALPKAYIDKFEREGKGEIVRALRTSKHYCYWAFFMNGDFATIDIVNDPSLVNLSYGQLEETFSDAPRDGTTWQMAGNLRIGGGEYSVRLLEADDATTGGRAGEVELAVVMDGKKVYYYYGSLIEKDASGCGGPRPEAAGTNLTFAGVEYFQRWSTDSQNEFTPAGQEDLDRWADMVTILRYRNVAEDEGLAATANAVLENYKVNGAMVSKTNSVPQTKDRPAEHFVAVVFSRPEFSEAVFARFRMAEGFGSSIIYSHRIYGREIGEQMKAWLQENSPRIEDELLSWQPINSLIAPKVNGGRVPSVAGPSRLNLKREAGPVTKEVTSWPELTLTGVIGAGSGGGCLINGQVISVGERIQGVRIVEVKTGVVVAEFQGERRELRMATHQ